MSNRIRTSLLMAVGAAATLFVAGCSATRTPMAPSTEAPAETPPSPSLPEKAPGTARYRVVFEASWSMASHPADFPSTAHFSPLVGGTHNMSASFWNDGVLASMGIKDMAERGRTSPLDREVGAAIAAGTAEHLLAGGALGTSPDATAFEFAIGQAHPLVTLVSMVAPSPDWFVGVSALSLFEDGQWVDQRRIDLVPWDAGTDSGSTFTSPDIVTSPPQPVFRIVTAPLSPGGRVTPLGTFTFTRLQS